MSDSPAPDAAPSEWLSTRARIGLASVGLLIGAALLYALDQGTETAQWKSASLRVGLVMGTLWLAWPELRRLSPWAIAFVFGGLLIALWRPRLLPLIVLVGVALYLLRPRNRSRK